MMITFTQKLPLKMATSLKTFLANAKKELKSPTKSLAFVIGNESADLDSLCCAIVYSYLRTNDPTKAHLSHIPISNVPRADFSLRPELIRVFEYAHLAPSDLLTVEDVSPGILSTHEFHLVDHNFLTNTLESYQPQVNAVIDHHVNDNRFYNVVPNGNEKVVEVAGSCMSLVMKRYSHIWEKLDPKNKEGVARLALAPMLIDTGNLQVADKTTDTDREQAGRLSTYLATCYYNEINQKKEDISNIELRDVMRKDYKQWATASMVFGAIASPQGFDYLRDMAIAKDTSSASPEIKAKTAYEKLSEAVEAWSVEKSTAETPVDIMAAMTIITSEAAFGRELLLWWGTDKGKEAVRKFEEDFGPKLRLQPYQNGALDGEGRRAWVQGDNTAGRKQLAPIILQIMNEVAEKQR